MKRKIFTLLAIIICIGVRSGYSQTPDWSRLLQVSSYGGQTASWLTGDENHIIMACRISGPLSFDGYDLTSVGLYDLIVAKISNSGVTEWLKQYNSHTGSITPTLIKQFSNGNIYLAANFNGTATLGNFTVSSGPDVNSFLTKMDSDGNILWVTPFYTFTSAAGGRARIDFDSDGNCYMICNGYKLIKFSVSGKKLWEQDYPQGTLWALSVFNDNIFVGGTLMTGITYSFGPITKTVSFKTGFMLKATLDGEYLDSLFVYGSPTSNGSLVTDIKCDGNGGFVAIGGYTKDLFLDRDTIINPTTGARNFIAKCDTAFSSIWANSSSGTSWTNINAFRVEMDASSNFYELGPSNGFTFSPFFINSGDFVLKMDSAGNRLGFVNLPYKSSKTFITPDGKIIGSGNIGTDDAVLFNNIFVKKYLFDLTLVWQKISTKSQTGDPKINYVKHDENGNIYSSARVTGYCDYFGTVINSNITKTVISKHNHKGNVQWIRQIDDLEPCSGYPFGPQLSLDKENNILFAGKFQAYLKIGNYTFVNQNLADDGYVAKYTTDGDITWAIQIHTSNSCNIYGVVPDTAGNVIVSGEFNDRMKIGNVTIDANGLDGMFVAKLDKNGNLLWTKGYPIGEVVFVAMPGTDGNNNIYIACEMYNRTNHVITIGQVSTPQTTHDGGTVLVKFDPRGNPQWVHTYGGAPIEESNNGWPTDIKTDAEGNCYLWGWCYDNAVFGSTTLANTFTPANPGAGWSYYLAKINNSGEVIRANAVYEKLYGYNYGDLLDLDKAGNIYAGGHFRDSINIDNHTFKPEGSNDFFMVKYSNDGEFQWIKTMAASSNVISSLSALKENSVTISGIAGIKATLGTLPIIRKGGNTTIMATLGDLPVLTVSADSLFYKANSNLIDSLDILSNSNWKANVDQGWITLNKREGSGKMRLYIIAAANAATISRVAILTLRTQGLPPLEIKISQASNYVPPHFVPVWSGNGVDQMNVNIVKVKLDGLDLESGDEVGVFDGTLCVGAAVLTGAVSQTNVLQIIVSANEGSGNGYTSGHSISFKLYDKSASKEVNATPVYITSVPAWSTDGKFAVGSTTGAELTGLTKEIQIISLNTGWNIISTRVIPDNKDLKTVLQPLIDAGKLKKAMDETGKTVEDWGSFGGWQNGIGNIQNTEGYKINVTTAVNLSLEGTPVSLPLDIPLSNGWNIISYPKSDAQNGKAVVQALIDAGKLKKVMDETGKSIEDWGTFGGWQNGIGNFMAGKGYKVNVSGACMLTITAGGTKSAGIMQTVQPSSHFPAVYKGNGTDHMNINLVNTGTSGLVAGDEIGVFDGSICVGSVYVASDQIIAGNLSIPVSCNDQLEEQLNGFTPSHEVTLKLYRGGSEYPLQLVPMNNLIAQFVKGGSLFAQVIPGFNSTMKLTVYGLSVNCYPNPFSREMRVDIQTSGKQSVKAGIYDLLARKIRNLYNGDAEGSLTLKWNGTDDNGNRMSPGIYTCVVNNQRFKIIFTGN